MHEEVSKCSPFLSISSMSFIVYKCKLFEPVSGACCSHVTHLGRPRVYMDKCNCLNKSLFVLENLICLYRRITLEIHVLDWATQTHEYMVLLDQVPTCYCKLICQEKMCHERHIFLG